jgi:hypothetical protein
LFSGFLIVSVADLQGLQVKVEAVEGGGKGVVGGGDAVLEILLLVWQVGSALGFNARNEVKDELRFVLKHQSLENHQRFGTMTRPIVWQAIVKISRR